MIGYNKAGDVVLKDFDNKDETQKQYETVAKENVIRFDPYVKIEFVKEEPQQPYGLHFISRYQYDGEITKDAE